MNSQYKAQDVIRCDLCDTDIPHMYCDICHINLCKACVMEHLSDESKDHKFVSFNKRGSTINCPKCQRHSNKICELHCNQCNLPICTLCVSSGDHEQHTKIDVLEHLRNRKDVIEKDLKELKESIYPKFQEAASKIPIHRSGVRKNSKELTEALKKQADALHAEIEIIVKDMQSKINDMGAQHLAEIDKQEEALNQSINDISQVILDLQKLLDSNDVSLVSEYTSKNGKFENLPVQVHVYLPAFIPQKINKKQIHKQFGILLKQVITYPTGQLVETQVIATEERVGLTKTSGGMSITISDEPQVLTEIYTEFGGWFIRLHSVSSLSDEEIWTSGNDKIMKLFNLQGELIKSIQTESGNKVTDIAVTRGGNLVYTDYKDKSINIVTDEQIQQLVRLQGWRPYGICCTSSDDLLVIMDSDDRKETKVVRYSGATDKQCLQLDEQGQPLFPSVTSFDYRYLTENRNLDVCVADNSNHAVVVVNALGKLRFRYTGPPSSKEAFHPRGIATDSQGRILTADSDSNLIHIVDQDGHFLCFVDNCGLQRPWGLCVDSNDNLIVAEYKTGKVKKVKCYQ
uniref:E3 ubiquitin-protein ligase TRIM71-like n=1 Tax=Crassostrea virginica TaxID=6565 RepID=A0A8B8C0M6_CRAVI|nr:E3 ubiquitin-protein ligase TRIM71-like [Crassostrea virginica]